MKPSPIIDVDGDLLPAVPSVRLAVSLLTFVAALFACGVACLLCGRVLVGWLWLPALAAGAGASVWGARPATADRALREAARAAVLLAACAGAALLFGAAFFDVSWDGQVYHQQAVLALAEGWNPLRDAPLSVELRGDNIWIDHYPKAAWIAQAILLRATGSLEATKGLQLLPLAAAALLVFAALRARGLRRPSAVGLCALIAGNPVAMAQVFSFYNDGMGASLMTAMLALADLWRRRAERWLLLAIAASIVVLVNLKFTGLVYGVLLSAGLILHARPRAVEVGRAVEFRWFVGGIAGAFALATLALGFDPYVTNLLRKGHPFYPLMGQGAVDIITIQLAPGFHTLTRPTRFLISLFARGDEHNVAPVLKWPFSLAGNELRALGYPDLRIGGFGPLFGLSALLAAAIALARRPLGVVIPARAWLLAALLLGIAFCNPALWWARYVPHLWLLPVGLLALVLLSPRLARAGRAAALAFGGLLVIDIALVAVFSALASARSSRAVGQQLDRLDRAGGALTVRWDGFEAVRARLRNRAIAFAEVDRLPCAAPERLLASRAEICPPAPTGDRR